MILQSQKTFHFLQKMRSFQKNVPNMRHLLRNVLYFEKNGTFSKYGTISP